MKGASEAATKRPPRKVGHVSFSAEAAHKPRSAVTVREEHGVYVDPLGRTVEGAGGGRGGTEEASPSSFPASGESCDPGADHMQRRQRQEDRVEYDNLVVSLGMLKCGFRYESVIPVPGRIVAVGTAVDQDLTAEVANDDCTVEEEGEGDEGGSGDDGDGEQSDDGGGGDGGAVVRRTDAESQAAQHPNRRDGRDRDRLRIRLSARRPGRYRGLIALELLTSTCSASGPAPSSSPAESAAQRLELLDIGSSSDGEAAPRQTSPSRTLTSVQVEATLMGKDQGKPQLKEDVRCLGRLVGYDSDEETEWQGFDP